MKQEEKISYQQQEHIFDPSKQKSQIIVIGVGSVGSFVVLNLAKLGFNNITVIDFDKVEAHNIPNQFYRMSDVNKLKTVALKEVVEDYTGVKIKTMDVEVDEKFDFTDLVDLNTIVIMSVDTMEARKTIFNGVMELPVMLLDTRMGGDAYQIFTYDMTNKDDIKKCSEDLDAATAETPCGEKSVIYTILSIASETCNIIKQIDRSEDYFKTIKRDMKSLKILGDTYIVKKVEENVDNVTQEVIRRPATLAEIYNRISRYDPDDEEDEE